MISLDEYVENMKAEQKDIYYIAADSVTSASNTPFLEKLLEKNLEVHGILLFYKILEKRVPLLLIGLWVLIVSLGPVFG